MKRERPWVVIGNPENRRVHLFQHALARQGQPPARVVSYVELITSIDALCDVLPHAIVRIDSPGENFEVEKLLLIAGEAAAATERGPVLSEQHIRQMPFDRGLVINPRQWYLGFVRLLTQLQTFFDSRRDLHVCNSPTEIIQMFDKVVCHELCLHAGISVPQRLPAVTCFDELLAAMEQRNFRRVFVKLAHGSSASGVVALHRSRNRLEAITSAEIVRGPAETRIYNSLKIRRYTDLEDVRTLIETLLPHRVHVERWLPKAALGRRVCDLRAVVIGGQPRQMVVRTSRTPLTNLHLGSRRGDLALLRKLVPTAEWAAVEHTCRLAAARFPRSLQLGLDILLTPGFREHFLLEINAFGDLLPNILDRGQDCYDSQVAAVWESIASSRDYGHGGD